MRYLSLTQIRSAALIAMAMTMTVACSKARWHETTTPAPLVAAPVTGDPLSDHMTVPQSSQPTQPGQSATVRPTNVCGHRANSKDCDTQLEKGDPVEVVPAPEQPDHTIAVKPKHPKDPSKPVEPVYVPPQYLSTDPIEAPAEELAQDRFFVVQNIATETLRVYENCAWKGDAAKACKHRLILQTPMVVGENVIAKRTRLGSFRITKWFKFYQDAQDDFPSFYREESPALPGPGSDLQTWVSRTLLPDGKGSVRGAFGWYTAYVGPDAEEQWMHGSWGWGADGTHFIDDLYRAPFDAQNLVASHGCTRVENQAIALMREFLVPGTKVVRIYAREALGGAAAPASKRLGKWSWELTRLNSDEAPRAGKDEVEAQKLSPNDILDSGTYVLDTHAVPVPLRATANPHESGNVYQIKPAAFKGVFFVDEGRVSSYEHPRGLVVGGLPGHDLPKVLLP